MQIDLNCDMGESFGAYSLGNDAAILPFITSANIACGFHAGDPLVIERTIRLAKQHNVAIGAHPGFRDLVGFGRRALDASTDEIEADVLYQLGAMFAFTRAANVPLVHVKAHGALYNIAATDREIANAIARAVARFDKNLILVSQANSAMIDAAKESGLSVAGEGFCDRTYMPDGTLQSRREPGAVISDPKRAAEQAVMLATKQSVLTKSGSMIPMAVDTLCIHGDTPNAVEIARTVRAALEKNGVSVAVMGISMRGA
jgi:UPF0271 protein